MYRAAIYILICLQLAASQIAAQVPTKRLPGSVNMPTASQIYPSLTGDGTYMVFYSNYTNTGDFQLMYSKKMRGGWDRGSVIDMYRYNLDHIGSHCLSYDGRYLFFSSMRSKGIGGFDIWYSERRGDGWSAPENVGKPVNTTGHEGHPSLSPDGKTLYFIRCERMDAQDKEACAIWTSVKKPNGRWSEPRPLPAPVNLAHETSPRILMDNETLVFASERAGGAGRQDLYITRRTDDRWSQPLAMEFLNTAANNEYIGIPAGGNVVYYTDIYKNRHHLYKAILPVEYRPKKIWLITGKVAVDGATPDSDVRIQAYEAGEATLFASAEMQQPEGTFFMALTEGSVYDFSVFPTQSGYTYHASLVDVSAPDRSNWVRPFFKLEKIGAQANIREVFTFEPGSADPGPFSQTAFKRLAGFIKMNPGYFVDVVVVTDSTTNAVSAPVDIVVSTEVAADEVPTSDDEWIDDSAWFGSDDDTGNGSTGDGSHAVVRKSLAVYDPTLALDRAMSIVNELQLYGCDISWISPGTDFASAPFDTPVADSLGYIVEIRLSK
jgi:hypothetical protein